MAAIILAFFCAGAAPTLSAQNQQGTPQQNKRKITVEKPDLAKIMNQRLYPSSPM